MTQLTLKIDVTKAALITGVKLAAPSQAKAKEILEKLGVSTFEIELAESFKTTVLEIIEGKEPTRRAKEKVKVDKQVDPSLSLINSDDHEGEVYED